MLLTSYDSVRIVGMVATLGRVVGNDIQVMSVSDPLKLSSLSSKNGSGVVGRSSNPPVPVLHNLRCCGGVNSFGFVNGGNFAMSLGELSRDFRTWAVRIFFLPRWGLLVLVLLVSDPELCEGSRGE